MDGTQWTKEEERVPNIVENYSIDDASWIPKANFDDPTEIPKMMERDKPSEDTI